MTRLLVGAVFVLAGPAVALGATLRVPEDYATVQQAINQASSVQRDTVSLAAGTYHERLTLSKLLVLTGRAGAEQTVIDAGSQGNAIAVSNVNRSCILQDLTLTGGRSTTSDTVGTAIYLHEFSSPTIQRCRLVGNRSRAGGAINAYQYCEPLVKDCWMSDNEGGAVVVESNNPAGTTYAEFENCVIVNNWGWGVSAIRGARVWIRNCTIAYNVSHGISSRDQARLRVNNSIISNNGGGGISREDPTVCFVVMECNDVYGNTLGDYKGAVLSDPCFPGRGIGDVSVAPCFQNADAADFHLLETSPLCSMKSTCGVLGAFDDPCSGEIELCNTSVERTTWGGLKQLFR